MTVTRMMREVYTYQGPRGWVELARPEVCRILIGVHMQADGVSIIAGDGATAMAKGQAFSAVDTLRSPELFFPGLSSSIRPMTHQTGGCTRGPWSPTRPQFFSCKEVWLRW
jgi:hypothetical protein